MGDLSKNFNREEFACPCCGTDDINLEFIKKLQIARDYSNYPFIINSGVRCHKHNHIVGGVDSSAHVNGYACDIKIEGSMMLYDILIAVLKAGFNRIGIAKTFIHIDCDPDKSKKVTWVY